MLSARRSSQGARAALAGLAAALVLAAGPGPASAQEGVIPPGREAVVLEAVREAFGATPAEGIAIEQTVVRVMAGDGVELVASLRGDRTVDVQCEAGCPDGGTRWDAVATRLRRSFDRRVDRVWSAPPPLGVNTHDAGSADAPPVDRPSPLRRGSWALLVLVLLGLLGAPRPWPSGSRRDRIFALVLVLGFLVGGLTVGDPRPLHDHLCNLERVHCAASLTCDQVHGAWGRPAFHVMGVFLHPIPLRLPWILGLGVFLTSIALWLVYDVTARVAARLGVTPARAGEVGLFALATLVLHPGLVRLAGAGSFWPATLVLLFASLHLVLRVAPASATPDPVEPSPEGAAGRAGVGPWRLGVGIIGAGAAFALALAGNRLALVLAPLALLAPWAWRVGRPRGAAVPTVAVLTVTALAALPPLALFALGAHDVLTGNAYGAASSLREPLEALFAVTAVLTEGAVGARFSTVLLAPMVIVALASRRRLRTLLPLAYAFFAIRMASLHVLDPLVWDPGYPDAYLKHFPQLLLVAPLLAVGLHATVTYLGRRFGRPHVVVAVAACALAVSTLAPPDARRLLFAIRPMELELRAITESFDALPPHDILLYVPMSPPPEGMNPRGDPLEMHFPTALYRAALEARGQRPGELFPLQAVDDEEIGRRSVLLYVGSTLRTFYADEIAAGLVPPSFERPELHALRDRFTLEPVRLFMVPTATPGGRERPLAAGRVPAVELGFYRVTPR